MNALTFGSTGVLGKLPARGDFVRVGAAEAAFSSFDAFLTEAIEWAEARGDAGFAHSFERAPLQAFFFRSPGRAAAALLAGAIAPSRDAAGRRFPLAVAAPLVASASLAATPELLPLTLEDCWQQTSEFLSSLRAASSLEQAGSAPALSDASGEQLLAEQSSYAAWAEALAPEELWTLIFGASQAASAVAGLEFIYQAVLPSRGREQPSTPLSLRVPLGAAGGAAVCFWLDFVRRVARWRATLPSFFWSHDGEAGVLFLCLGEPPQCTLAELWHPTGRRDEVCDLSRWLGSESAGGWREEQRAASQLWSRATRVSQLLQLAETRES